MKLTDLLEEIIWEGEIDGEQYIAVILDETISVRNSGGGLVNRSLRKGAAALKSNPDLAALGAGLTTASYTAYSRNRLNHVRLFAKTQRERKIYLTMINDLMKTGGYRKIRERRVGGGWLWELKKK